MSNVVLHVVRNLPPRSAIQVNPNISCVCPELLFFQMATSMELAKAVMIGYELCGNFAIQPANRHAKAATLIPAATCVEDLARYIDSLDSKRGIVRAREVLSYVSDGAISVPEAAIATMYSLPSDCGGYGLGTVTLNQRVLADPEEEDEEPTRFPDLLLSFVPIGVNYDGEKDHLDLDGLVAAVRTAEYAEGDESNEARDALAKKLASVRAKYMDDIARNCQLAARGYVVMPATKENLYGKDNFDVFTKRLLLCAKNVFGANVDDVLRRIDDTNAKQVRYETLQSLLF